MPKDHAPAQNLKGHHSPAVASLRDKANVRHPGLDMMDHAADKACVGNISSQELRRLQGNGALGLKKDGGEEETPTEVGHRRETGEGGPTPPPAAPATTHTVHGGTGPHAWESAGWE